ncbi:primosomal replication protein N [Paucibacter sp. JuS9]|uniref:primosomal replication protein N n=1 Tax=Roseateles TaxID=93681 RepID=UPI002FE684F2
MNQLVLQAQIQELGLVRYTPAGLAALDFTLKAESEVTEAGRPRKVSMEIKAVAIGEICRSIQALGVAGNALFKGFLSNQRNGRGTIFHVTVLERQSASPSFDTGLN